MQWLVTRTRKGQWRSLSGSNLVKYILNYWEYILQLGQIHFAIQANTFSNSDKYFLQFRQIEPAICSGWSQEQGRDSGGVWGPILSLPSSSRPHLSDAHLVISFCPSPSNLVRGGRIWSRRWRGSSEMEPLCHCLTGDHPHAVLGSAKFDAGRLEKLEDALVEQMLTWLTGLT